MSQNPNYNAAFSYARQRLQTELDSRLEYHNLEHTQNVVLPSVERLAALSNIDEEHLLLLRTAAWFHDIGFVKQAKNHEEISIGIAESSLPDFGYSPAQITRIASIIQATKLPQNPQDFLGETLADADLSVLGLEDFIHYNKALRRELANYGPPVPENDWYAEQLKFVQEHQYFTEAAQSLYTEQKERNIALLRKLTEDAC